MDTTINEFRYGKPYTLELPCCHSNAHCGCQRSVWWQPPRCLPYTLYRDSPESREDSLSKTPGCTLRKHKVTHCSHTEKKYNITSHLITSSPYLEQHLGLDHRGSCCCAPGLTCVCRAAASLPGCTCVHDKSDGLRGSRWICFCWSALPPPHRPLKATLRTETHAGFSAKTITSGTSWSFTVVSHRRSLSVSILRLVRILFLRERRERHSGNRSVFFYYYLVYKTLRRLQAWENMRVRSCIILLNLPIHHLFHGRVKFIWTTGRFTSHPDTTTDLRWP